MCQDTALTLSKYVPSNVYLTTHDCQITYSLSFLPCAGLMSQFYHCLLQSDVVVWTHPYTVFLSVLLPVVSCVTEHQQVRCQPIRAAIAALRGHSCDLGPLPQVNFQPLIPV